MILHRCGKSFYFLIVSTWRNDNELWDTVWAKNGDEEDVFSPWPVEGTHRPTFCVWELGAVWHEQQTWSEYLRSERDEAATAGLPRGRLRGSRLRSQSTGAPATVPRCRAWQLSSLSR